MIRILILVLSSLVCFANASAAPNGLKTILTAAPRALGRTAANMVTFKDGKLAAHQWLIVAAIMANAGSDVNLYHRCRNCYELDKFVYGLHPSSGRLIGTEIVDGMALSTIQQVAWELSYEEHSRERRVFARWFPTAAPVLVYSWLTYCNTAVPSDGSRSVSHECPK